MLSSNGGARSQTGLQRPLAEHRNNTPAIPTASPSSNTKCIPCQKIFKRPEHLRRHQKSHHGGGGYTCSTCGKQFARRSVCSAPFFPSKSKWTNLPTPISDVLVRHEFIHSNSRRLESAGARRPRACEACARARERCSRGEPCQRCTLRAILCEYRQRNETPLSTFDPAPDRGPEGQGDSAIQPWVGMEGDVTPLIEAAAPSQPLYHHLDDTIPNIDLGMNWLPASNIPNTNTTWASILEPQLQSTGRRNVISTDSAAHHTQITALSPAETSSPASATSNQSTSTNSSHSRSQQGKLYATSSSARAPVYEAEKESGPEIPGAHAQEPISRLSEGRHPAHDQSDAWHTTAASIRGLQPPQPTQDAAPSRMVWESTYQLIVAECQGLRLRSTGGSQLAFPIGDNFPTLPQMNMLIDLFYSGFSPSLPILHGSLSNANDYWILTLAMATIGCHYTKTKEFDTIIPFMHKLLSKSLAETEMVWVEPHLQLSYVQALLLSQIGLYYYGPPCMRAQAVARRGYLIYCANTLGLLGPIASSGPTLDVEPGLTARWHGWILDEAKRRLGYSIWVRLCF